MNKPVQPIPAGYDSVIPYLIVRNAAKAIEFYKQLFGATEVVRMPNPEGGSIMHAELKIRNSMLMLTDENPKFGCLSPLSQSGQPPLSIFLYVPDVDAVFAKATSLGATVAMPLMDAFWGDRYGKLVDPFGHVWSLATHKEDVPPQEMPKRAAAAFASMK